MKWQSYKYIFQSLGSLTVSWRRSISYRHQSIYFQCKSMNWFIHGRDLRHDRVKSFHIIKAFELQTRCLPENFVLHKGLSSYCQEKKKALKYQLCKVQKDAIFHLVNVLMFFVKNVFWSVKPALHCPFNWNQLVVRLNLLKHTGCYTLQLIDDICWIFSVSVPRFSFHADKFHSFLFSISWKVWTCLNFSINWNQFSICSKSQFFCCYITQLVFFKKSNSIKLIV